MSLKTTYVDSVYTQKEYRMTQDSGYVTMEDITSYSVDGDYYGCEDLNSQNLAYNQVDDKFSDVQSLLTKLSTTYGMTVTNSPSGIETAINLLASQKYTAGYNSGVSYVQSHASSYGLKTKAEYDALKTRISQAINYLSTAISCVINVYPVAGSFSDPITASEASAFKSSASSSMNACRNPYTTFKNSAITVLNNAISQLSV